MQIFRFGSDWLWLAPSIILNQHFCRAVNVLWYSEVAGFPPASGLNWSSREKNKHIRCSVTVENDSHMLAHVSIALLILHIWEMIIAIAMVERHLR